MKRNSELVISHKDGMSGYHEDGLIKIYNWARLNGFEDSWRPSGKAVTYRESSESLFAADRGDIEFGGIIE